MDGITNWALCWALLYVSFVNSTTSDLCKENDSPSAPHTFLSQFAAYYNHTRALSGGLLLATSSLEECARFCVQVADAGVYSCGGFQFERPNTCSLHAPACVEASSLLNTTDTDYYVLPHVNESACSTDRRSVRESERRTQIRISIIARFPDLLWNDDLLDEGNTEFINTSQMIIEGVKQIYTNDPTLEEVLCHNFSSREVAGEYINRHGTPLIAMVTWDRAYSLPEPPVAILGYLITYRLQSNININNTQVVHNTTKAELRGLQELSRYEIQIQSITSLGVGISSRPVSFTTTKRVIPPFIVNATVLMVNHTWSAPLSNRTSSLFLTLYKQIQSNIYFLYKNSTFYNDTIVYSFRNSSNKVTAELGFIFNEEVGTDELPPLYKSIYVRRTLNNILISPIQDTIPGKPPTNVSAQPTTPFSIRIAWMHSTSPHCGYMIFYKLNTTQHVANASVNSTTSSFTISKLQRFSRYEIWIRAKTRRGLGLATQVVHGVTLEEVTVVEVTVAIMNLNTTQNYTDICLQIHSNVNDLFKNDSALRDVSCTTIRNTSSGFVVSIAISFGQEVKMYHFKKLYSALYYEKRIGELKLATLADNIPGRPPKALSASAISPTSLNITWNPINRTPTRWIIHYSLLDNQNITMANASLSVPSTVNSTLLTGLQKFARYKIWMQAETRWGLGMSSHEVVIRTLEEFFPVNVTVRLLHEIWDSSLGDENSTYFSNLSATITNSILSLFVNDSMLKQVDCCRFRNERGNNVAADIQFTFRQHVTMQPFRILYDAIYRQQRFDNLSIAPVFDTIPGKPPSSISAVALSTTSIVLNWTMVMRHQILPTHALQVEYRLFGSQVNNSVIDVLMNNTSVVVRELEKFRRYAFQITAATDKGLGVGSNDVFGTTLEEVVPQDLTVRFTSLIWNTNLSSSGSQEFRDLCTLIQENIYRVYSNDTEFRKVVCRRFRNGSLIADMTVIYGQNVGMRQFAALYTALYVDGTLHNLTVQPLTDSVPGKPPVNLTAIALTSTSFRITWECVDCHVMNNTVAFLTSYRVKSNASKTTVLRSNSSDRSVNVTGLERFTTYAVWVNSVTQRGNGIQAGPVYITTLEDVPSLPPSRLQAWNISSTSVNVTWRAVPSEYIHGVLQGYEVRYRKRDHMNDSWSVINTTKSYAMLMSLDKFTWYNITVMAYTKVGGGPFANITVMTDEDVPSRPPSNIRVRNTSSTSLLVAWDTVPSGFAHGIVTGYHVTYQRVGSNATNVSLSVNASMKGIEIKGLAKYTEYVIKVLAFTNKGHGKTSNGTTVRTDEDVPSQPPGGVKAYNISSTSLNATWDRIPFQYIHGVLLGYRVFYRRENDSNDSHSNLTSQVEHAAIGGLDKFTRYSIQVLAYTSKGDGAISTPIIVSTDEDRPSLSPTDLQAYNTSSTSLHLYWGPVPKGHVHGILIGYQVLFAISRNVFENYTNSTTVNTTRGADLQGLEKFTVYMLTVSAFTIKGNGPLARNITVSTDEDVPSLPPANLSAHNTSSTSLQINWDPVPHGFVHGILRGYRVLHRKKEWNWKQEWNVTYNITTTSSTTRQIHLTRLQKYTVYSLKVLAFTVKGNGAVSRNITVRTDEDVPSLPPQNVSAYNTSSTSVNVTWLNIPDGHVHGILLGYRVLYEVNSPGDRSVYSMEARRRRREVLDYVHRVSRHRRSVSYSRNLSKEDHHAHLTGLQKFTKYSIRALGYTRIGDGAKSPAFVVTTDEDTPSRPPSSVDGHNTSSTSLEVLWGPVPTGFVHGILLGYRVKYRRVGVTAYTVVTLPPRSERLDVVGLRKYTDYQIILLAFTRIGNGTESQPKTVRTDEDKPSRVPPDARAINKVGPFSIRVEWSRLRQKYIHGVLLGFRIDYTLIRMADREATGPKLHIIVGASSTSAVLEKLETYAVYRISIAAFTSKGLGPRETFTGITCNCVANITTNWWHHPPYVTKDSVNGNSTAQLRGLDTPIHGIIPPVITAAVLQCCGDCVGGHRQSAVDFSSDGFNGTARKSGLIDVKDQINNSTFLHFPISGITTQTEYYGHDGSYEFVSIMETNGAAFIVADKRKIHNEVFMAILGCYPTVLFVLLAAYLAGIVIWIVDVRFNPIHFPRSFIGGSIEGFWWSFATMTTVGYGDRIPKSIPARLFALSWTWMGIATIAVLTSTITASLMSMVFKSDLILYGTRVAAIQNSSEYKLGLRRNAKVEVDGRKYGNVQDIYEDLENERVHAALLDSYATGSGEDLFNKPWLRVKEVIKPNFQSSYGVVLGGDAMKLSRCMRDFVKSERSAISKLVEKNVKAIKTSNVSPAVKTSSSLLTSESPLFMLTVKILGGALGVIVIIALIWEYAYRQRRQRKRVSAQKRLAGAGIAEGEKSWPVWVRLTPDERYACVKEDLRNTLKEFYETFKRNCEKLKLKHALQIEALKQHKRGIHSFSVHEWIGDRSASYAVTKDGDVNSILDGLDMSMFDNNKDWNNRI